VILSSIRSLCKIMYLLKIQNIAYTVSTIND
jgi:hypothetical protein